jgi:hypothetical protein
MRLRYDKWYEIETDQGSVKRISTHGATPNTSDQSPDFKYNGGYGKAEVPRSIIGEPEDRILGHLVLD